MFSSQVFSCKFSSFLADTSGQLLTVNSFIKEVPIIQKASERDLRKGIEILAKVVFSFSIIVFNMMELLVILFIMKFDWVLGTPLEVFVNSQNKRRVKRYLAGRLKVCSSLPRLKVCSNLPRLKGRSSLPIYPGEFRFVHPTHINPMNKKNLPNFLFPIDYLSVFKFSNAAHFLIYYHSSRHSFAQSH